MGSRIYFAPGQYSPDTARGQQLLGHELAHVLQQRSGRVRSPAGGGMVVVNDHALEAEADRMGVMAASFRPPIQTKMASPLQAKPASHKLVLGAYMHQGASAAGVSAAIYGLFAIGSVIFVAEPIYILFVVLGSWIGTYSVIKKMKK